MFIKTSSKHKRFRDSLNFFDEVATTEHASEAGISFISGYEFFKNNEFDEVIGFSFII